MSKGRDRLGPTTGFPDGNNAPEESTTSLPPVAHRTGTRRVAGTSPASGKWPSRSSKLRKYGVIALMVLTGMATPFVIFSVWNAATQEIIEQAPHSTRTAQEWEMIRGYEIIGAFLLMLAIFLTFSTIYALLSKNEKLVRSQQLLGTNAENFNLLADNIGELITKHSVDGTYKYLSPSCKQMLGYTPEELIGTSPYDLLHPESVDPVHHVHQALFEFPDNNISTYQIRRKDGIYVWLETSNIVICDPVTNEPLEILSVSRDVTKKREEENQIKKMVSFTEDLLQTGSKKVQYQQILENLLYISKAKIGFITLLNETTGKFVTQAIVGMDDTLKKINQILGYDISKEEWFADYTDIDRTKDQVVARFHSLSGIPGGLKSENLFRQIEEFLPYGEIAVVKIIVADMVIGNFTLIMPYGEVLQNEYFIEIYSRQINIFMTRIKAEENLRTSEDRMLSAQSMAHVGNWELNLATKQMWASREAFNIYGIPYETPFIPLDIVQNAVFPEFRKQLDDALLDLITNDGPYDEEFKIRDNATGKTKYVHSKAIRIMDDENHPIKVVGAIQDITTYKKSEEEILYLSFHDQLTGLYNRRFYEESLAFLDKPEYLPISIAMGDVNGLKLVNDSFGHTMGDELLAKAAAVIKKGCREKDIAARLGGDEFVIVMPRTDAVQAEIIMNRIQSMAAVEKIGALDLSISFGYETKTAPEQNIHNILKATEDHMYRHKLCESSSMRNKTIDLIINTLYEKNHREMTHSKRVSILCEAIATKMDLDKDEINQIKIAGLMHDIGKIGIDDKILNKTTSLAQEEWREIERHAEIGYRILSSVNEFSEIADYILEHHERWDGTGYPRGLRGKEISLPARIIVFAEAYEAMTGYRSYRTALSEEEALEEIRRCAGTQFDPEIALVFIEMMENNYTSKQ